LPEQNEAFFREIVENLPDVVYVRDLSGNCTYVSPSVKDALGHEPADLVGSSFLYFVHPEDRTSVTNVVGRINGGASVRVECRIRSKGGEWVWVGVTGKPVYKDGVIVGAQGLMTDVSDRRDLAVSLREHERKLHDALAKEREAKRADTLTDLNNRKAFYELGEHELRRARRYSRPTTLAYIDLDNFKLVNEQFGPEIGDQLLAGVSEQIQSSVRNTDVAARLGGDEFAVLFPETNRPSSQVAVEKLHGRIIDLMHKRTWPVTASIGLASFTTPPPSFEDVVREAEKLMQSAKRNGKNRITTATF
jgi:diguanylate cyclase (GGDEF)-like protein/PAS domain S-box-containing protein